MKSHVVLLYLKKYELYFMKVGITRIFSSIIFVFAESERKISAYTYTVISLIHYLDTIQTNSYRANAQAGDFCFNNVKVKFVYRWFEVYGLLFNIL